MLQNNAILLRRELMIRIARLFFEGQLQEQVDRIPIEVRPRQKESTRCCIYRDRALIKYRCMALMGARVEEETDELKTLASYANDAFQREQIDEPILTVLDEACSACLQSNYFITNACRGCLARPCTLICAKKAIKIVDGQAQIDSERCVNCGRCMQACSYHAIIQVPIPCEEACPTGAISKIEGGKERIDFEKCISCGKCLQACPFGAIMERSQMLDVLKWITSDRKVIAMVAPSIVGQFNGSLEQIVSGILALGFDEVVEVALGADAVIQEESAEFKERMARGDRFMTTSCCYAYRETVRKHLPELSPFVSSTPTPMHKTAEMVSQSEPEAIRVFIGPCICKRKEGLNDPLIDYVLTFEELGALLVSREIEIDSCTPVALNRPAGGGGRGFPVSGGVRSAIQEKLDNPDDLRACHVNGLNKQVIKKLKKSISFDEDPNFVEVMACEGGCVAGPCILGNERIAARKVEELKRSSNPD